MKEYNYQLTEIAKEDIEQIGQYIADNFYVNTAISVIDEINSKIEDVCKSPLAYEKRDIFSDMFGFVRIAFVKNYNIYFAVDEEIGMVYIIRVAHCTMNLIQYFVDG